MALTPLYMYPLSSVRSPSGRIQPVLIVMEERGGLRVFWETLRVAP